jgi:hypothetical protein
MLPSTSMTLFSLAWMMQLNSFSIRHYLRKIQVEFLGDAEWYIGIKFNWHRFSDATITCCLSQEGYASAIVEEMGLSSANKCPMMTPFRSGFPIDTIPHLDITPDCENAVLDGNDKLASAMYQTRFSNYLLSSSHPHALPQSWPFGNG